MLEKMRIDFIKDLASIKDVSVDVSVDLQMQMASKFIKLYVCYVDPYALLSGSLLSHGIHDASVYAYVQYIQFGLLKLAYNFDGGLD